MEALSARRFSEVLEDELREIVRSRERRGVWRPHFFDPDPLEKAAEAELVGLSFSGGGIRSATFGLGVIQALAENGLLRVFDYLSTVSGGGFIGSWLVAWVHRLSAKEEALDPLGTAMNAVRPGQRQEAAEIRFIRHHNNYLTPRKGLFGVDSLTMSVVYVRNLALNLAILAPLLMAVLIVPRLSVLLFSWSSRWPLWLLILGSLACLVFARSLIERHRVSGGTEGLEDRIAWLVLASAWLMSAGLYGERGVYRFWWWWVLGGACAYPLVWFLGRVLGLRDSRRQPGSGGASRPIDFAVVGAFSGAFAVACLLVVEKGFRVVGGLDGNPWHLGSLGWVAVAAAYLLTSVFHIGIARGGVQDEARERWSRVSAAILKWGGVLLAVFAVSIYLPRIPALLGSLEPGWPIAGVGAATLGTYAVFRFLGQSRSRATASLGKAASYLFAVGVVVVLSWLTYRLLPCGQSLVGGAPLSECWRLPPAQSYWENLASTFNPLLFVWFLGLGSFGVLASFLVDVNQFSMHAFFRNRLVRCFLGASNLRPGSAPPVNFDPDDDLPLASIASPSYGGPYPILNAALNLVSAPNLAWQHRKAASFVFTPRYCGYEVEEPITDGAGSKLSRHGYRPTDLYGQGVKLGTAMTISGAALSPNMGFYTSGPLSFLMTLLNVRLGWWLGNPRHRERWKEPSPKAGLLYLFRELFGGTNERSSYVHLSDGGHFENLGIYELVRRRCTYIVAVDAGEDRAHQFSALGNAIQKCRTDFGVDIEIDLSGLRPAGDRRLAARHCAVGRIHYDRNRNFVGTLVYLRPTLTGDEPPDIDAYAARNRAFPHQPTSDQWFDEAQFESYRALGHHVAKTTFGPVADRMGARERADAREVFTALRQYWYPPVPVLKAAFTRHTEKLLSLWKQIRDDERLRLLDFETYPALEPLRTGSGKEGSEGARKQDEFRAAFYLCNQMIQLMENVYLDLDLEVNSHHPDVTGWLNFFRQWAASPVFQITWAVTASTFGARFRSFCERELQLKTTVELELEGSLKLESDEDARNKRLEEAQDKGILDTRERAWLAHHLEKGHIPTPIELRPLKLQAPPRLDELGLDSIYVGFALLTDAPNHSEALRYLWVKEPLRRMGLGRKGSLTLIRHGVETVDVLPLEAPKEQAEGWERQFRQIVEREKSVP